MGGGGSPDGAVIKFKVLSIEDEQVLIEVEGNKYKYFEVGKEYEAAVRTKQP